MALLQNKLNLRVAQKQILTPGLVQMVSVLALNKLELKDMITAEIVENPVLEEIEESSISLEEIARKENTNERVEAADEQVTAGEKNDPFEEIDFGSFFRDYLDPGYRTHSDLESLERPSFENFLSRPTTLTDHLMWQLGSLSVSAEVHEAAERIIGNLNEDGYLTASEDELRGIAVRKVEDDAPSPAQLMVDLEIAALNANADATIGAEQAAAAEHFAALAVAEEDAGQLSEDEDGHESLHVVSRNEQPTSAHGAQTPVHHLQIEPVRKSSEAQQKIISIEAMKEAVALVQGMDPIGVAAHDLRECLVLQLQYHVQLQAKAKHDAGTNGTSEVLTDAIAIVGTHLRALQNKQYKEISKAISKPIEAVMAAFDFIRTLDPKPGARYNQTDAKLIEPDAAFVKHGDEWLVMMNEDDVPQLRLNPTYKRLLHKEAAEKDVRNYVKERYKSAIQLIKNIEQRKQTILKVCYSIIDRQRDFLERGIDQLKPMMIKEVAEEIGVHPSTVSRAVASKYVHTPQGVFELRYFFSESVNGPEGGGTSLLILKRRVKKLIDNEDPAHPLTDDQITKILQSQGIQVTRRTVAKYREDLKIPSTHQRRVKD